MLPLSQSVKRLGELWMCVGQRTRCRRARRGPALLRRASFLGWEALEPRLLLSTTQPFDPVNNLNGYIDLGGELRFTLENEQSEWQEGSSSAILQVQQDVVLVGAVPTGGASYVPLLQLYGNVAVNASLAEFMLGVTSDLTAGIYYKPQGKDTPFKNELFDLKQDTPWIEAAEVVGDGVTIDAAIINAAATDGVAVAPNQGVMFPSSFRLDKADPHNPQLVMQGDLSIHVPKLARTAQEQSLIEALHINFGTGTVYSVTANKDQAVQIQSENDQGGVWVSMATKEFRFMNVAAQIQQAEFSYDSDKKQLSIFADVALSWDPRVVYLEWGTSRDAPGLTLQGTDHGWEVAAFGGAIGTNKHGNNENSEMEAAGSKFTISQAGFAFDRTDETLQIFGTASWTLGAEKALTVSLGTSSEPGLVLRDGKLARFDAAVTTGALHVGELEIELANVAFSYDRYSFPNSSETPSPYDEPQSLSAMSITQIADQFYHPNDSTDPVDVYVGGAAAGATVTVTASSSDQSWLANSMLIVTRTADPNVFDLAVDVDPNTAGNQAPSTGGKAAITVTAGDGKNSTTSTFDFTVGDEQIVFSGSALLSVGNAHFQIGILPSNPWSWTEQGGQWKWDVGSLVIGINGQFGLGPITIEAKDLQIQYVNSADGATWSVGGSASIPILFHAEVGFGTGSNPGLKIYEGNWEVSDLFFSVTPPHIGAFGLEQLQMHYSRPSNGSVSLDFGGAVAFPGGFSVGAEFEIVDGKLEMIHVDYDAGTSEGIPIGDTGVFITSMGAEIQDLSDPDLKVSGDIAFAAGPSEEIGGKRRGFLTGDGSFWVNRHGMEIDVNVAFEGGLSGTGEGKLMLDWQAHDYRAQVSVTMLGGVFEVEANFELTPGELLIGAKADVTIPSWIPYIGGKELADIDLLLSITPQDKFVAAWTHVDIDLKIHTWQIWVGVEYDFTTRKFSTLGHKAINKLQGEMPDFNQPYKLVQAFTVPATANGASFEATWAQPDDSVQVYILPPSWSTPVQITSAMQNQLITQSNDPSYVVSVLPDRSSPTSLAFVVRPSGWSETNPAYQLTPGDWNISVVSDHEVWPNLSGSYVQPEPVISLDVADSGRNTANVTYNWRSADPDHSTLTLYYDEDAFGYDGHSFATITPFTKPSSYSYFQAVTSSYAWPAASLENLQHVPYSVYGILDDGTGIPVYTNYSTHTVTPQPAVLAKVNVARGVDADKSGWTVKLLDADGKVVNTVDGFACSRQTDNLGEVGFNVPAGTYTVVMTRMTGLYVARAGQGQSVDDNGNIVQTVVVSSPATQTVSPTFTFVKRSEISGRVFADTNANGRQDPSDLPLDAWQVYLDVNGNGRLDDGEPVDTTDNDGVYALYVDPPASGATATWQVRQQTLPPDYELVTPDGGLYQVTLSTAPDGAAPAVFGRDFLDARVTSAAGIVYDDLNSSGSQDPGEPGLPGITVTLTPKGGTPVTAKTDAAGRYVLKTELAAGGGDYQITVQPPSGASVTAPAFGIFDFGQKLSQDLAELSGFTAQDPRYADVVAADFNGDGNDDMLVMVRAVDSESDQPVSACALYLYRSNGYSFEDFFFLTTPGSNAPQGTQLFVGDLDGDPTPEIVTVTDAGQIVVADYAGGSFTASTLVDKLAQGGAYARVALVDLNGDGRLDILGNDGHAWINGGALHFTHNAAKSLPDLAVAAATGGTALVVSGDLTGSGHARTDDIAYAYETYNGEVAVVTYQRTAPAAYSTVQSLLVPGVTLLGMTAGDVNGDDRTDLAVVTLEQTAQGPRAFLHILVSQQGSLGLAATIDLGGETLVGSLKIRDIDHDGDCDIGLSGHDKLLFVINEGRGVWSLQPRNDYTNAEVAGDYPRFDIAHIQQFTIPGILVSFASRYADGLQGMAETLYKPATQIQHLVETQFSESRLYTGFDFGLHGAAAPAAAQITGSLFDDRDADGRQSIGEEGLAGVSVQLVNASSSAVVATATTNAFGDYAFSAPAAGNYRVQLADSALQQTTPITEHLQLGAAVDGALRQDPIVSLAADFNGDGLDDVATITTAQLIVAVSNPAGGASAEVITNIPGGLHNPGDTAPPPVFPQFGDLDRDGDIDIVISVQDPNGDWDLLVFSNQGAGAFQITQRATSVTLGVPANDQKAVSTPRLADLNADGLLDLLWFSEASAKAYVLLNTGGTFAPTNPAHAVTLPHTLGQAARITPDIVDLNGDGLLDITVYDPVAGALVFLRGYGLGAFSAYAAHPLAHAPGGDYRLHAGGAGALIVRDLDCDSLPDVTVASAAGVEILWNNGGFQFTEVTLLTAGGLPGNVNDIRDIAVVVKDLTGDGSEDLGLVYTGPAAGNTNVTAIQNLGDGKFGTPAAALSAWNQQASLLIAGDLDGDHQAELILSHVVTLDTGEHQPVTVYANQSWTEDYFSVSYAAGADLGGYNFGAVPPASTLSQIQGAAFQDRNSDKLWEANEAGIFGLTVYADLNGNSRHDVGEPLDETSLLGTFRLAGLAADSYNLRVIVPSTYTQTTANPATIKTHPGQTIQGVLFGLHPNFPVNDPPVAGFGYALALDGVNDGVEIGAASFSGQANWTFSAWINPQQLKYGMIYSEGSPAETFAIAVTNSGAVFVQAKNQGTSGGWLSFSTPAAVIAKGQWSFVAVRLSNGGTGAGTITVFVNDNKYTGSLQAESPGSKFAAIGSNVGGLEGGQPFYAFPGLIDEVRLWTVALADTDVRNYQFQPLKGNEHGLAAWYRFDENLGTVAHNASSGDANDKAGGTLVNGAGWAPSGAITRTSTTKGTAANGTLFGDDPNGDTLHFVLAKDATQGHVSINPTAAAFTFTPHDPQWTGTDTFTFFASDGGAWSALPYAAQVVVKPSSLPSAVDDTLTTDENRLVMKNVLRNDTAADGKSELTMTGVDDSVTVGLVYWSADGSVAYDPRGRFAHLAAGETAEDSFQYTVSDGQGGTGSATVTVMISGVNEPPTAALAGPAAVVEGSPVSLTASAADVDASDVLAYQWTVAKDGAAFTAGAGPAIAFTPDDNGSYLVQLTVSDGHGGTALATHEVLVSNAPPVASLNGPATGIRGQSLAYDGQCQDPGTADTHVFRWEARTDTGTGTLVAAGTGTAFTFAPLQAGVYSVALTVTDDDGAADTASMTVTVARWALSPCATDPNRSVLTIVGSDGPDQIDVSEQRGRYAVSIREYHTGFYEKHEIVAALCQVVIYGYAGNDTIAANMDVNAELFGGAGDDRLYGGGGDDLLVGGAGNDWLWGRDGNDDLDGGDGADWLFGGFGGDTLAGGPGNNHLFGGPGRNVLIPNDGTLAGEASPAGLASDGNGYDVNLDGQVTAGDALAIVNYLNEHGSGPVPNGLAWPGDSVLLLDVDGSQTVEPVDALQVVNWLNAMAAGEGEGEAVSDGISAAQRWTGPQTAAQLATADAPAAGLVTVRAPEVSRLPQWQGPAAGTGAAVLDEAEPDLGVPTQAAADEVWLGDGPATGAVTRRPVARASKGIAETRADTDAWACEAAVDAFADDVDRVWNSCLESILVPTTMRVTPISSPIIRGRLV